MVEAANGLDDVPARASRARRSRTRVHSGRLVARPDRERLSDVSLAELLQRLEGSGLHSEEREESRKRLEHLRGSYELYVFTISHQLALDLPDWVPAEVQGNWRAATRREFRGPLS